MLEAWKPFVLIEKQSESDADSKSEAVRERERMCVCVCMCVISSCTRTCRRPIQKLCGSRYEILSTTRFVVRLCDDDHNGYRVRVYTVQM